MTWECPECCNEYERPKKPAKCPECGSRKLISADADPREKGDDDGREYGHPDEALAERRHE